MLSQVDSCSYILLSVCSLTMLSQVLLQFLFSLQFDHALTGSIIVFLFQLAFDHALSCAGCIRVSFVTLLFDYT